MEDLDNKVKKYRNALQEIYKTESGKIIFDFLSESYVDGSAIDKESTVTYYKLGQKEFVQGLINDAKSKI
jgi:hypothetical protein